MSDTDFTISEIEKAVFEYLFELQDSGKVNMFGSVTWVMRKPQFKSLGLVECDRIVEKWMLNYEKIASILKRDSIEFKN